MPVSVSYNNQNNSPALNSAVGATLIDSTAAGQVPEGAHYAFLSPEGLMSYIEGQLRSVDDQIFNHMKEVEGRRKAADALSQVSAILKQCEKSAEGKYLEDLKYEAFGKSQVFVKNAAGEYVAFDKPHSNTEEGLKQLEELKKQCPGGAIIKEIQAGIPEKKKEYDAVVSQFYNAADKLKAQGYDELANKCLKLATELEAGTVPSADTVAGLVTEVDQTMTSLSSASEMTMIRLQELMQQRSRTIMFVTNAMASMNEASRKIIDNTR